MRIKLICINIDIGNIRANSKETRHAGMMLRVVQLDVIDM